MGIVRFAVPDDAQRIAEILRSGFRTELLPYTVFGCKGVIEFLRDSIHLQARGGSSAFIVYDDDGEVFGFAEFRRAPVFLFLNHIYVAPSARGCGIGRSMLLEGIRLARDGGQEVLALDVFTDNVPARKWYEAMGLMLMEKQVWLEIPSLSTVASADAWYTCPDLAQADRVQAAYGFSQFLLQLRGSAFTIGRLGETLFRSTEFGILSDVSALSALGRLDINRGLLCIDRVESVPEEVPGGGHHILGESYRLAGNIDQIVLGLSS